MVRIAAFCPTFCRVLIHALVGSALLTLLPFASLQADFIRLKDGGTLHGTILNPSDVRAYEGADTQQAKPLTIRLLDGTTKEVAPPTVGYSIIRPLKFEEYEDRLEKLPDSLKAHWELAEWCRKNGLDADRRYHLERVLDFDPQHDATHRILGEVRVDGEWITIDEQKAREGLVKYKGRYAKPEEIILEERMQSLKNEERVWIKKIRSLRDILAGPNKPSAIRDLESITDPAAVKGLLHYLQNDPEIEHRKLLVKILSRIHSQASTKALVAQGLFDSKKEVSELSFAAIPIGSRSDAVDLLIKALKHQSNDVVNRAATGLAMLDGKRAVGALISALLTNHVVPVQSVITVPSDLGTLAYGELPILDESRSITALNPSFPVVYGQFGTRLYPYLPGGNYTLLYGFGGPKWTPMVERKAITEYRVMPLENPMVRSALRELTGNDFGYDTSRWRRWWAAQQPLRQTP